MSKKTNQKQSPAERHNVEQVVDDLRNRVYQQEVVARLGQQALAGMNLRSKCGWRSSASTSKL